MQWEELWTNKSDLRRRSLIIVFLIYHSKFGLLTLLDGCYKIDRPLTIRAPPAGVKNTNTSNVFPSTKRSSHIWCSDLMELSCFRGQSVKLRAFQTEGEAECGEKKHTPGVPAASAPSDGTDDKMTRTATQRSTCKEQRTRHVCIVTGMFICVCAPLILPFLPVCLSKMNISFYSIN